MTVAEFIVDYLIQQGVTDTFGIPGGVILELLYAMKSRELEITPHLNYHEQTAAFAACGYAQTYGRLGVAYATRGPGIANMITTIIDAYCDSIPVLFITAHSFKSSKSAMRVESDQEIDLIPFMSEITKYAARIDKINEVKPAIETACSVALSGRKGPVILDIDSALLKRKMCYISQDYYKDKRDGENTIPSGLNVSEVADVIYSALDRAKRPVLLIGDGIRQSGTENESIRFAEKVGIPVLSSRFSQDIMSGSPLYYGYIGSHGIRFSNFILSKADLIIALGNRMSFPVESQSYEAVITQANIIRIDIDETEYQRRIPNCRNYLLDIKNLFPELMMEKRVRRASAEWITTCDRLREYLWYEDISYPVEIVAKILNAVTSDIPVVSDVGNNEFWLSRASVYARSEHHILYSKSFGVLGCSLGKAIGVYYSAKKSVLCFAGDQGLQLNIQELQYISRHRLPIVIVLLNNSSSGMIRSREKQRYHSKYVLTTKDSGYSVPDFSALAKAYGIDHYVYSSLNVVDINDSFVETNAPCILEVQFSEEIDLTPNLPIGAPCQKMMPELPVEIYEFLNGL